MHLGLVMRLVLLFALGCGPKEEDRVVTKDNYPGEYAAAICAVQIECDQTSDDLETCSEATEESIERRLEMGCFDAEAAAECLDILESIDCEAFMDIEEKPWSICADVDDCSEV